MTGTARTSAWLAVAGAALISTAPVAALQLERVAGDFERPVYLTHAGDARVFVVEQPGRIKVIVPGRSGAGVFLDIRGRVRDRGNEQGLLSVAFHPDKLKVCTSYKYKGEVIDHLPYNIEEENITPIYTEVKGWKEDLTKMTDASQIPQALNEYISFLENELEVPIKIVSVGPDRTQTIHR